MSSMRRRFLSVGAPWVCLLTLSSLGCGTNPACPDGEDCTDAGALPPDFCNSRAEADSDSVNCLLVVNDATGTTRKTDVFISRLPDGGADQDWYLAPMPSTLTARSLLHVNAGYSAPQTQVNFSVNILTEGANGQLTSIGTASDNHGSAAPKPVDLIMPFSTPNAKVYLLVGDLGGDNKIRVDNRNPYSVLVQVRDNPDSHEPNDTAATATTITTASAGDGVEGTSTGYLATPDDVDEYVVNVSGSGRSILYVHLTEVTDGGVHPTNPPPPYKLGYVLFNPQGTQVSEGHMENEFMTIDLATSRVVTASNAGQWRLEVKGYKESGSVGGDLRIQYAVDVRVLPEKDTNEPNDTFDTAKTVNLSALTSTQLKGKLSTVPDEEWFKVVLAPRSTPSTLRYKLTVAPSGGRFLPLSSGQQVEGPNRYLRVLAALPGGTTPADCSSKQAVCPKSYTSASNAPDQAAFVGPFCNPLTGPPLCLYSQRQGEQQPPFTNMKNVVGAVPVPAAGGTYYVLYRDEGRGVAKYADDRDWTIDLTWADDPDEATPTRTMALGGSTTTAAGDLTYGYGAMLDPFSFTTGAGIRGSPLLDYDAYESDEDLWELTFGGASAAQGWSLEWQTDHGDGGVSPGEVFFELTFCNAPGAATGSRLCPGTAATKLLGYVSGNATPWYLNPNQASNARKLFTQTSSAGATTISMAPEGCWCFSTPEVTSTHFFLNVRAANRVSNEPIHYTLRQSIGAYPSFFLPFAGCPGNAGVDAGTTTCDFSSH